MVAEQQPELLLNKNINNRSSDNRMQQPERELRGWARSQGERGQSNPAAPGVHYALERHGKPAIEINRKHTCSKSGSPEGAEKATGSQECPRNPGTANSLVRGVPAAAAPRPPGPVGLALGPARQRSL